MKEQLLSVAYGDFAVIADSHLQAHNSVEVEAMVDLVAELEAHVCLIILGDLFDAWVGPSAIEEGFFPRLRTSFMDFRKRGGRTILVRGNRDALMEQGDVSDCGIEVCDMVVVGEKGSAYMLTHGDQFCIKDRSYQFLRTLLRWSPLRFVLRKLPLSLRQAMAKRMRKTSQGAVARKPMDQLALVDSVVEDAAIEFGASKVIIGHLHQEAQRELTAGLRLHILPAWEPGASPYFFKI